MSMSQEEIEALMNGLDIPEEESSESTESEETSVNTDEIEELIAQTSEESNQSEESENITETESSNALVNADEIDDLLKEIQEEPSSSEEQEASASEDNDVQMELDELVSSAETTEEESSDDLPFEDLSSDLNEEVAEDKSPIEEVVEQTTDKSSDSEIDNIMNDFNFDLESESKEVVEETVEESNQAEDMQKEEIVKDWADTKINEGVIPLPADKDTKVVNQLTQVANDSEEKVGQIFDVLSFGLDTNNEVRNNMSSMEEFIDKEKKLLESLSSKFPNISVFKSHIENLEQLSSNIEKSKDLLNQEDMKIFEAMELMQFNDINRQKIERVMSVIRKLSTYLNNLFEDDGTSSEIVVAKHIAGDDHDNLVAEEELDKLIAEFENK